MTWLAMTAFPGLRGQAVEAGAHFVSSGHTVGSFCLAIIAGSAITLLTQMHNGTENDVARVVASVAVAFLIAGLQLSHSVLDSLLIFAGIHAGGSYGYLDWLSWFWWALLGNLAGGIGLTTILRLVRSQHRIQEWRETK
jgi:formate/nitrite transporter FocA (FNT family)